MLHEQYPTLSNFQCQVLQSRKILYYQKLFADVTLVCDDFEKIVAHKTVLASSSDWFKSLLQLTQDSSPFIFLKGVSKKELEVLLEYIYLGEVSTNGDDMDTITSVAQELGINDFQGIHGESSAVVKNENAINKSIVKKLEFLPTVDDNDRGKVVEMNSCISSGNESEVLNNLDGHIQNQETLNKEITRAEQDFTFKEEVKSMSVDQFLSKPFDYSSLFYNGSGMEDEEKDIEVENFEETNIEKDNDDRLDEVNSETPIEGEETTKDSKKKMIRKVEEEPSECSVCAKEFTTKRSMQRHHKVVHELILSKCKVCHKEMKGSLYRHMLVHFPKIYTCKECNRNFRDNRSLERHTKRIHIGV